MPNKKMKATEKWIRKADADIKKIQKENELLKLENDYLKN